MSTTRSEFARQLLTGLFRTGVDAVHGKLRVAACLDEHNICGEVAVVAIGKAAVSMWQGAAQVLGARIRAALLVSKAGCHVPAPGTSHDITCLPGGHPVPDESSLAAGDRLLAFIRNQPKDRSLLFLISGGSSSMVEVLPDGLSLGLLQRANRWLLASGLDIATLNQVRRRMSLIKGGGLLDYLDGRSAEALLISDVQGDDPASIGSGLLYPARAAALPGCLPGWLQDACREEAARPPETAGIPHTIVGSLRMALDASAAQARKLGHEAYLQPEYLAGNIAGNADRITAFMRTASPGIYFWGGEMTVQLPAVVGQGGRNQQFALYAALKIADQPGVFLLAAGTDGIDGNTGSAGAIVDAQTVVRAQRNGLDARQCLRTAGAAACLEASQDLLVTGPTGTNVCDMVIACKLPGEVNYG